MQLTRWMVTLGAAGALALAGCGGDDEEPAGGGGATTPQETATPPTGGGAEAGKEKFATTCGGCHTLAAAGTTGQVGPSLDELKPDKQRVLDAIKTGPGQMPENLFEGADAEEVADYVSSNAGG